MSFSIFFFLDDLLDPTKDFCFALPKQNCQTIVDHFSIVHEPKPHDSTVLAPHHIRLHFTDLHCLSNNPTMQYCLVPNFNSG